MGGCSALNMPAERPSLVGRYAQAETPGRPGGTTVMAETHMRHRRNPHWSWESECSSARFPWVEAAII
jgi:hypothetical protein